MRFLEALAERIIADQHSDLSNVAVVLPSKRAGLFLKKYLAQKIGKPFFPPAVITFNEFLDLFTEKKVAELPELLFLLYETYCEITKDSHESFDRFSKWGQIMLNDFNEIDRYLIEPEKLFIDLRNIKIQELEIESWSFKADELSISQSNYLEFWKGLPAYHSNFNNRLAKIGLSYQGAIYREVSQSITELSSKNTYSHTYFAGFNALSNSEMKIISHLYESKQASLFFDADKWYTNDGDHEAGLFFRKLRAKWGDYGFELMGDFYREEKKKVTVISAGGTITQARVAGELLNSITKEKAQTDIALVLADENLLLPVLNSLPEAVEKVNITMGFPLKNSDYYNAIETIFELQETLKIKADKTLIYYKSFLKLITHPVFSTFLGVETFKIKESIIQDNIAYLRPDHFDKFSGEQFDKIKFLFSPWKSIPNDCFTYLNKTNELICDFYLHKKDDPLTLEYIYHFSHILNYVHAVCEKYNYIKETKTLLNLIKQYIGQSSISFFGEPLSGIQLMGMLETRALDFKNVIVLGVNENTLPKSKKENSFILHEVKKLYGLPTYKEKDAVFANHFYRLLQRTENVCLVYNNDTDALQGGEKSRFIQQLEHELKTVSPESEIIELVSGIDFGTARKSEIEIKKTPEIIAKIKEHLNHGISPSALNKYLECPLNYYYRYVLNLKEPNEVEEVADNALLGTIIHATLESFYKKHLDQSITLDLLKDFLKNAESELKIQFTEYAKHLLIEEGKNHLLFIVALEFVKNFIQSEIRILENPNASLKIIGTEREISMENNFRIFSEDISVKLAGKVDRIDVLNEVIRIIDYKTGQFNLSDVQIKELTLSELKKKPKALQLLIYGLMYAQENKSGMRISSGIIPLKTVDTEFAPLSINKEQIFNKEIELKVKQLVEEIIKEMLNPDLLIQHNKKSDFCELCDVV